jgi:heptosyltransferase I
MTLTALMDLLGEAQAVISVDTGLGHLAAALGAFNIALYGPTSTLRAGTQGARQHHMVSDAPCAPCLKRHCALTQQICFKSSTPQHVFELLKKQITC